MTTPDLTRSTSLSAPSSAGGPARTLADAWIIAGRDLAHWVAQPGTVIVGWLFPVMIAVLFGQLFGGAIGGSDGQDYIAFLIPGMLALTMFFGIESTVTSVSTDASRGVTDRFRSLPMSGVAVVLGRCIADMLASVAGLATMIAAGLLLGWRWHDGLMGALAAVGLLLMLRFALLWVGIFLGLIVRPEGVVMIQMLVWPVGFLSSVFVDPATMPGWLAAIAQWNPLSSTATAVRSLFGNPGHGGNDWVVEHAILLAVSWPVLLVAVFLPLAAWRYRRLGG